MRHMILKPILQKKLVFLDFFFLFEGEKMTFCDNKICHFDILNKFYITCIKVFFLLPLQILIEVIF